MVKNKKNEIVCSFNGIPITCRLEMEFFFTQSEIITTSCLRNAIESKLETLKDPKALEFFQNRGKFENRHFGLPPPLKIDKNDAFSFRSC